MRKIYFLLLTLFSFLAVSQKSFGQYCTVTFPSNVEPITLVQFNTINNASSNTVNGTPALQDFTAISTNVFKTISYPITVKGNTDGNFTTRVDVYIDWNQDLDFLDAGENFFIGTIVNSTGLDAIQTTGNILIPATALTGNTRMRVMKKFNTSATPCNNTGFGQAEDYTLNIQDLPPCVAPPGAGTAVGPAGSVCPGESFTVNITGGSFGTGITYSWESSATGADPWTPTGITTASLTTSATTTTWYRRRITCSSVDAVSNGVQVTITAPLTLPFTETFASYLTTFPPTCWTRNNITFITGMAQSAYGIGTGSARFNFFSASSGTQLDLATAAFTPVPAGYRLTFDHAYATFGTEVDRLEILYSTNGGASYTALTTYLGGVSGPLNTGGATTATFAPTAAQWASKGIALPTGTNKLLFRGVSAFGNMLFVDNIRVEQTPSCLPPTSLTTTALGPTTATLSWTASATPPSGGYQWEVRTSGAAGSGATGLATSGTTAAGVTTANATGLTPNTTYSYYVRSDCGGANFSAWTLAFVFTTPCNPIATPFTETFSTYATTFPPTCWTRNNTTFLVGNAANAYVAGTGSAKFDFYNASSGTNLDLVSPLFTAVPANYRVTFDHAYATFTTQNDQLQVSYSTDGGSTWTILTTYNGGTAGPLNTAGASIPAFTPTTSQWLDKAIALPVGTNRLRFRGISAFGNNLYLDNIRVELTPSCLPVTQVSALAISPTSAMVNFTSPGTAFIVEHGPVGFTPGTGATAGTGGTLTLGTASPITISGLTPATTYDVYVRRVCIPGVDYSTNVKTTVTSLCAATNIPYVQNFETSVPLVGFPTCTSMQDVNGNSGPTPNSGGGRWITNNVAQTYRTPTRSLWYIYDFGNPARGGDDWFYLQGLNLTAGNTYRVKAYFKGSDAPTWVEKFEIKYGTLAHNSAMTNLIYTSAPTTTTAASPFDSLIADFTPAADGVYYIGFHNISDPDQAFLFIDDISVTIAPKVDVGITGVVTPDLTCPRSGVFIQANIRNYNTTVQNFATYPVTVTANITGAATGTVSTVLNTGTLNPGAEMGIYLSPAFNFTAPGVYNITVTSSSPDDPETGNDSYTTSVIVTPNPPVPVITPSAPAICAGGIVALNTQFAPPAPPTTVTVASGTISVPVPDGSAVGATHSLTVSGIPVGASITGASVTVNHLSHTWVSDMVVNIKAPNGRILNLFNARGGSGDSIMNMTVSSTGTALLSAAAPPFTGTYAADAALGAGPTGNTSNTALWTDLYSAPNGTWTLVMRDLVGFDVGILKGWTINITYQVLTPTITWTPTAGLFTNAGATAAYTGGNAYSLWASPTATTTYTVAATTAFGCRTTANVTVTVNPNPTVTVVSTPDTVCISDQVIPLSGSPAGGTWTGIGVSGTNFIPPSTAVGTYTLTYTYTNTFGCTRATTRRIVVKDCPERIIRLADNALFLYPNPNNGQFNIRINSVLYNKLGMRVYANNGMLVRTQELTGLTYGRVVPIDLSKLPGGVYMVNFHYEGGVRSSEKTFKVVIGTP